MFLRFLRGSSRTKIICIARVYGPNTPQTLCRAALQPHRSLGHLTRRRLRWKLSVMQLLSGLRHRYCLWRLRRLLGVAFDEGGFQEGTRQAAATMIEAVRQADWPCIRSCCTERGSADIYGLSQDQKPHDSLVIFQRQHLRHALPVRVVRRWIDGRSYVLVDMLFVGLRNLLDLGTAEEKDEMVRRIETVLANSQIQEEFDPKHCRLAIAELVLTFCKELGESEVDALDADAKDRDERPDGWLVDSYALHRFKLISFSPKTLSFRVIEFPKPV
ncbi:uncharacterized protein LOC108049568 [Drosophila rhopaloa]|uniref:Uncharacterized protein LOC108049568 isoform X2 n=1 Tax=Drosophila rhopaloa TaxID=1041015 RepID=A0A6P4F7M7_DRORH|nr:uncharacterized protein LOC108049568 [Drosophila rhopaloa]